jgi:hypothetical protein
MMPLNVEPCRDEKIARDADVAEPVDAADFNRSAPTETLGVEPLKVGES